MSIPKEVQALMDQAKKIIDIGPALHAGFQALTTLVGGLQQQVANLQAGAILTDDDKQAILTQTSELAATFSTLLTDIPQGTGVIVAPPDETTTTAPDVIPPLTTAPAGTDTPPALDPAGNPPTGGTPGEVSIPPTTAPAGDAQTGDPNVTPSGDQPGAT